MAGLQPRHTGHGVRRAGAGLSNWLSRGIGVKYAESVTERAAFVRMSLCLAWRIDLAQQQVCQFHSEKN
jgi:hypothetical protein